MSDLTIVLLIVGMSIIVGVPGAVSFAYALRNGRVSMARDRLVSRVFELERMVEKLQDQLLEEKEKNRELMKRLDDLQIAYDMLLRRMQG